MTGRFNYSEAAKSQSDTPKDAIRGLASAWANLDGTGTIALLDSENISSVSDNSTANYTFSTANSFDSANYSWVGIADVNSTSAAGGFTQHSGSIGTSFFRGYVWAVNGNPELQNPDSPYVMVQALGDLA